MAKLKSIHLSLIEIIIVVAILFIVGTWVVTIIKHIKHHPDSYYTGYGYVETTNPRACVRVSSRGNWTPGVCHAPGNTPIQMTP